MIALAVSTGCGAAERTSPASDAALASKIDAIFLKEAHWDKAGENSPGCAVKVKHSDKLVYDRAEGLANMEFAIPINSDTKFDPASIAKSFTAAAVLTLAEDGKLQLSDNIRKYLPEIPDYGTPITVDELLTHTSGIRDYGVIADIIGLPREYRVYTNLDVLDLMSTQKGLNFQPGSRYAYNNGEYVLLAIIVERASGKSFQDYTRQRIFMPLGMTSTGFRQDHQSAIKNQALGYEQSENGGFRRILPIDDTYGASGVLTTTGDLIVWNDAVATGRLGPFVTSKLLERAILPNGRKVGYGHGINFLTYRGSDEIGHGGDLPGYTAWTGRYPKYDLSIAFLCNMGVDHDAIARQIADLFISPETAAASAVTVPGASEKAGLYTDDLYGFPHRLVSENGRLRLKGGGLLRPLKNGRLFDGYDQYVFRNSNEIIVYSFSGNTMTYERAEPVTSLNSEQERDYFGSFWNSDLDIQYDVFPDHSGKLTMKLKNRSEVMFPLRPIYKDAFAGNNILVQFKRDASGTVTGFSFRHDRLWNLPFNKVTHPAPVSSASVVPTKP